MSMQYKLFESAAAARAAAPRNSWGQFSYDCPAVRVPCEGCKYVIVWLPSSSTAHCDFCYAKAWTLAANADHG